MARLIDADALNIRKYTRWFEDLADERQVERMIREAPTIDAVPVVRGEWFLVSTTKHAYDIELEEKCSICGRYVYRYDTQPQDEYCPNCGAKMDKERENNV